MQVQILFENKDFLAAHKPCGLNTHAAHAQDKGLWELLQTQQATHLGLHHRLDKDTSGVVVFSKTKKGAQILAHAFESRSAVRRYRAIVCGQPKESSALLEHKLLHKQDKSFEHAQGKRAQSRYRLIESRGPFSLIELELITGLTHQLRAQCALAGFPILGDRSYGGGQYASRQFLHCVEVAFEDGENRVSIRDDGEDFLQKLDIARIFDDIFANVAEHFALNKLNPNEAIRLFTPQQSGIAQIVVEKIAQHLLIRHLEGENANTWCPSTLSLFISRAKAAFAATDCCYKLHAHPQNKAEENPLEALAPCTTQPFFATEHGCQYLFDFSQGPATGLYLDQRENRLWVKEHAHGRVLNLFAYTCGFSVAAALGSDDVLCTSVDVSRRALDVGRMNFTQNGLDPGKHHFYDDDVIKYLRRAKKNGQQFDCIICDPPSFGRAAKSTFSLDRELDGLMQLCLGLLAVRGFLLFCVNKRDLRLKRLHESAQGAAQHAGMQIHVLKAELTEEALGPLGVGTDLKTLIVLRKS